MIDYKWKGRVATSSNKNRVIAFAGILVLTASVALVYFLRTTPTQEHLAKSPPNTEPRTLFAAKPALASQGTSSAQADAVPATTSGGIKDSGPIITSLWEIDGTQKLLTATIEEYLAQLAELGEAALPEIEAFLKQGEDVRFPGQDKYRSLRLALFEVLHKIGGDQVERILAGELQYTVDPLEIATLARLLDDLEPEKYRELAMQAAEETLAIAWQGELQGKDLTPLFQVFRNYGDSRESASVLERNLWKEWGPPAMVALAELDDDAGIALLTRMAQSSVEDRPEMEVLTQRRLLALHMLAQLSPQNRHARTVLFEQAARDRIPDRLWSQLASALAGDEQLQIDAPENSKASVGTYSIGDNIVFAVSVSSLLSPSEVQTRLQLIDELRAVAQSPDAILALDDAEASLERIAASN